MPETKVKSKTKTAKVEFHTTSGIIIKPDEYYGDVIKMRCQSCRGMFGLPKNGMQLTIKCDCGHTQKTKAPHPFAPRR